MENRNNNKVRGAYTEMGECPFCNHAIVLPSKADVVFQCPYCYKELITYDKTLVNETEIQNNITLVYCRRCGKQISGDVLACPYCGQTQNNTFVNNNDISLGYLLVSFLIPLIGIILCFLSWNKHQGKTKSALIGTLLGLILTIGIYVTIVDSLL